MDTKITLGVIIMITLSMTSIVIHQAQAVTASEQTKRTAAAAPPTITGDNIYVAW
jgi:hypothetical protein